MTQQPLPLDGLALRDQGMTRAINGAVPWPDLARAWIRQLETGTPFTSEDMTTAVGLPHVTTGTNANNAVGAVMAAASRAGEISHLRYVQARRPISHATRISLWERT